MTITIPDCPPSLNKFMRMHWAKKHRLRDNWILLIRCSLPANYLKPMVKMSVKVTLRHSRLYDKDNAYGACKVVFDALKYNRLILDDTAEYLDAQIQQEKCRHKERHTVIELEAA